MLSENSSASNYLGNIPLREKNTSKPKKHFVLLWLKDSCSLGEREKGNLGNGTSADDMTFLGLCLSICNLGKNIYIIPIYTFQNAICKSNNGPVPLTSAGSRTDL